MPDNIDIYRSAKSLINHHGEGAEEYAIERLNALLEKNDAKGAGVWLGILKAIEDLRIIKPMGKVH
jgi:hypothetical protein